MKYLKQVIIILIVCFAGELLNYILPIPVPAGIYGMIILFLLLFTGVLKLNQVEDTADFLLDIMPLLFVPAAVGIMEEFERLKQVWWQIIIITIVTTAIVMAVSGRVTQWLVKHIHPKTSSNMERNVKLTELLNESGELVEDNGNIDGNYAEQAENGGIVSGHSVDQGENVGSVNRNSNRLNREGRVVLDKSEGRI